MNTARPTIGSLFTGSGALCELAVAPLLGGRVAWHCEHEPPTEKKPQPTQAAARMLAHRFPKTPNLGDVTAVDWSSVEPIDILTGGFPCTDVSAAGQRLGLRPGTRSGTWTSMAYAISVLRPELVVIENVRGLASAGAHSDVEPCPWCVGDEQEQPVLRALGAVLGDLADLGYDAWWCGLPASDVGACHARFRFVIVASPRNAALFGWNNPPAPGERQQPARTAGGPDRQAPLLPTPRATDGVKGGPNQRGSSGDLMLPSVVAHLLPTPLRSDAGPRGGTTGFGLRDFVRTLMPPATAMDARGARNRTANRRAPKPTTDTTSNTLSDAIWDMPTTPVDWGIYEPAIRQHEQWLGRPVPHPTITGARGGKKLNPQLSEWMMGWPAGWVTDVPGITPNEALQVCGNGVVPQQIQAGLRHLLPLLASALKRPVAS